MWSRKRLDLGWGDLAFGAWRCIWPTDPAAKERTLAALPAGKGQLLGCLSVRSAFDLLLTALNWPLGSELLVSAVTIPDIVGIIEAHGLKAIPIDLRPEDLSPRLDLLQSAITPATRGLLIAHLFGGRVDLDPITELAHHRGLLLIEDCAQAFRGPHDFGHPRADVSLFSFGPIKTATALGGSLARVRDEELLQDMSAIQAAYPLQSRVKYLRRIIKYAGLKLLSGPIAFGCLARTCRWARVDLDRLVNGSVRGFDRRELLRQIRQRPCAALLSLLERRLTRFDLRRLESRTALGLGMVNRLAGMASVPGATACEHTHWVLPVLTNQPRRLIESLRDAGFDATQGRSLCVVSPPADRTELDPSDARATMTGVVFIPCYPELPPAAFENLVRTLIDYFDRYERAISNRGLPPVNDSAGAPSERELCTITPISNASSI
jgi:perosamine synthetase